MSMTCATLGWDCSPARACGAINVMREQLSVREHMTRILRRLASGIYVEFSQLFDPAAGIAELVVSFLGDPGIAKESLVQLSQSGPFAPIYVRRAVSSRFLKARSNGRRTIQLHQADPRDRALASQEPLTVAQLKKLFDEEISADAIRVVLDQLQDDWRSRGVELAQRRKRLALSGEGRVSAISRSLEPGEAAALFARGVGNLAIIAYKQPVTRGEIEEMRGVIGFESNSKDARSARLDRRRRA